MPMLISDPASCYVVVSTVAAPTGGLHWNAHLWIGTDALDQDAATAAFKVGELDART